MTTKICILCKLEKQLTDFYNHPQMTHGVDSKCKDCVKERAKIREKNLRKNEEWLEKERIRGREKHHRLYSNVENKKLDSENRRVWMTDEERKEASKNNVERYLSKNPTARKESTSRYRNKYPEKYKAIIISQRIFPLIKGNELHHWNYNIEFSKDVIELNPKDHAKIHRFIKYDQKTFMYKDLNGNLLDTREKHEELINKVINNF